jgi:hypothetical protein
MLRLYELPADVPASAETRRRYAKFAHAFYEEMRIFREPRNSHNRERATLTSAHDRREFDEQSWFARHLNTETPIQILQSNTQPYTAGCLALGVSVPGVPGVPVRVVGTYCHITNGGSIVIEEVITNGYPRALPIDRSLAIARSIESAGFIYGHTYHPIRFPYVSSSLYYDVECTMNIDYEIVFTRELSKEFKRKYSKRAIFYNPIRNCVEDVCGYVIT